MLERVHKPHFVSLLGLTAAALIPMSWTAVVRCVFYLLCPVVEALLMCNAWDLESDLVKTGIMHVKMTDYGLFRNSMELIQFL